MSFWNKKIFGNSKNIFGLDLSDLSVKVVQLEQDGKIDRVKSYGSANIAPGSILDGEIKKKENVVVAIQRAIETAGPKKIRTKKVVCSLPETKAFLRIINIPKMDKKEAKEAIKWEMEANIPVSIEQVYYDWEILEKNFTNEKGKMSVLVVAVAQNVVDQFIDTIEAAGLEVMGMDIESVAQANSLLSEKDKGKTNLVIDLGDRRTTFLISVDGIPCFTSSIPLSAQSMTDAISKSMGIPFDQAEKTKIEYGIGGTSGNDVIFKSLKPVLESFVSETERFMDFYLTGMRYSNSIDKIILCGGGSNTKGLIPFFSRRLGQEVGLGNPWVNFNLGNSLPIIEKNKSIQYSTAIGLALKGIYYSF
jgi:type IV pilus assembly protein PilM